MDKIKVSIIVPIYNVEEYLVECLESLVNQTLREIEVIMVDDGSTDSSFKIAKKYADKYENFYAITKVNGGLGQARNFGLSYVRGEYIAFVDSDDYLSKDAYKKLYDIAKKNNSDIAIGNVKRFNSKSIYDSVLHTRVFKDDIMNTHITKNPELIYDTTAWNKIFSMEFWKSNGLIFPEGILYEDIPVTIPAHFLSKRTSVLSDVIYYWRERDGITKSITQERTDITNFTDRLYGLKVVDNFLENRDLPKECIYNKYYKWIDLDLKLYINKLDQVDEDYKKIFIETVKEYLKTIPKEIFKDLRAIDRMKYYCIESGKIDTLLEVIKFEKNNLKYINVINNKGRYIGDFPFKDIPSELFDMTKEVNSCKPVRKVQKIKYIKDELIINGYCYIPRVNYDDIKNIKLSAKIINKFNNKEAIVDIKSTKIKGLTQKNGIRVDSIKLNNRLYNYDWCGYEININLSSREILNLGKGLYNVIINLNMSGIDRDFIVGGPVEGRAVRPRPYLVKYNKFNIDYNKAWDLIINIEEQHAGITKFYKKDNDLYFEGWIKQDINYEKLLVVDWKKNIRKNINIVLNDKVKIDNEIKNKFKDIKAFTFKIPKTKILKEWGKGEWFLNYYKGGKRDILIGNNIRGKKFIIDNQLISMDISLSGAIIINNSNLNSYMKDMEIGESKAKITICSTNQQNSTEDEIKNTKLILISKKYGKRVELKHEYYKKINNNLEYVFIIKTNDNEGDNVFISDNWNISLVYNKKNNIYSDNIKLINKKKFNIIATNTHKYKFISTDKGNLELEVLLKWSKLDKGPRRREAIERYLYPLFKLLPIKKKTIVFESYWGDKYNCNPRALYEYIDENHKDYKCVWSVSDESIKINGKAKKVRIGSLKYYYYMSTSKYFVNNVNFPDFHIKRKKSVELQTMHGTPLKTLGLDVPNEFKTEEGKEKFIKRCERWDYLTVSSDKVSQIAESCFKFNKEFLKVGYPRIDRLFKINNKEEKNRVREELNIPRGKKVILYVPTWRVKDKFDMKLDIKKMKEKLGNDYILLLRLHPFSVKGLNKNILNDFVIDVTGYNDIEKLYVLSDLIITDYSSVMFDYCILNKPMIFFAYDLETYKNNLRGFYFDFNDEAPGPIVYNSDQLIKSLENLDKIKQKYKNKMKRFKKKYCQYEQGNSCEQIFYNVFAK